MTGRPPFRHSTKGWPLPVLLRAPGEQPREDLAGRLSDAFETKVRIQIGRAKGRIVVEFGSVDDLQRIIGQMAPDITGRHPEG